MAIKQALDRQASEAHLTYSLTCSVGYVECGSPDAKPNRLISEADEMLYRNKARDMGGFGA
jgi:GGDEF domain-containing protein